MPGRRYQSLRDGLMTAWCPSITGPSGGRVPDLSPYRLAGTLTNMDITSAWTTGGGKPCLSYDTNDDVRGGKPFTTQGTLSLWLCARAISSNGQCAIVCSPNAPTSTYSFAIGVMSTGVVRGYLWDGAGRILTGETITTDQWVHVGLTFRNNGTMFLYTSGIQRGSVAISTATTATTWNWMLGSRVASGIQITDYWNGWLDDFRVYNRDLSAQEMRLLASERGIGLKPERNRNKYIGALTSVPRTRSSRFLGFPT